MNKDHIQPAESGTKRPFQLITKTASRWSKEGRYYFEQAEKTQAQKHYKTACRGFVNWDVQNEILILRHF